MRVSLGSAVLVLSTSAFAQWNPPAAEWGKVAPTDLRVMTWNVEDAICSTNAKTEGANNWTAVARIVAALKPDVLFLAETADNVGNGTGTTLDSIDDLTTTIAEFVRGGVDAFHGNSAVTAWVQKYAPNYDLPYVFVSSYSDGFNRNAVLSRYPFKDLNGDGKFARSDIPPQTADAWSPGGNGGIRGFLFVEVDLPDALYLGDFVLGGAHLKAGTAANDHDARIVAAQNVSYQVRYWWNGNGGSAPDPSNVIADIPPATKVLDLRTPIVLVGDWNEDETANGATRGPADWLAQAAVVGGTSDGTDADGTDMLVDNSVQYFTAFTSTHLSGKKYDYIAWQDSIATLRLSSVFESGGNPSAAQPPETAGFLGGASSISHAASDHRPVFADLELVLVDCNGNGVADAQDIANGTSLDSNGDGIPDECQCAPPANYCVAKANSLNCTPAIDWSGAPQYSGSQVFDLRGTKFLNNKTGLVFYGSSSSNAPFEGGVLCVKPPIHRTSPQSSGGGAGGNDCSGVYHFDFNALIHSGADASLIPGATVYAQYWSRDPQDPFTTSLSGGLVFTVCP